ncbi:MAG: hypothetical protein HeimC2_10600 [Candidatus Heimdallarchaeota archaeon LC_2]|nr:MAG: hypothetical protein HeimC2_10600 [Candidatus Heimdallarchaeota archaeon LC_2]
MIIDTPKKLLIILIERLLVFAGIGLLGLLPIITLYKHFFYTKILDYFLLGTAFLIAVFQAIVVILIDTTGATLLLFQINDALYPTFILMFLIHGARLKWDRTPNLLKLVATGWYGLLIFAVFFYKIVDLPSEAQVLFFKLQNSSERAEGQMWIINEIYIIGRGFEFYAHAFRVFSIGVILFSYLQTREFAKEIKVNRSQNIFILSILSAAVFPIGMMGQMLFFWNDAQYFIDLHIFDLFTFLGMSIIALKYPETLLISKTQILRVLKINQQLLTINQLKMTDEEKIKTITNYISFLKRVYPDLMGD